MKMKYHIRCLLNYLLTTNFLSQRTKKNRYVYREIQAIIFDIENILHVNLEAYLPLLSYILIVYYPGVLRFHAQNNEIIYVHSSLSRRHSHFWFIN